MLISSQLRRNSNPSELENVIVFIDDLKVQFEHASGSASSAFQMRIRVHSDIAQSGSPDAPDDPWSYFDIEKIFYAAAGQLATLDNRLRGSGNIMAGIRTYCKNRIDEHNETVLPGGTAATHVDLDDDTPS